MRPIALLTDFGYTDPYVAAMKGVIAKFDMRIPVYDVSHGVDPQDTIQAAYFLRNSWNYFPNNTVFLVVVDPEVGTNRKILCMQVAKRYVIAPDNGILEFLSRFVGGTKIRSLRISLKVKNDTSNTFHGRDIMAPLAAQIAKSGTTYLKKIGPNIETIRSLNDPKPNIGKKTIRGEILYFDHYGNAISNIAREMVDQNFRLAEVKVMLHGKGSVPLLKNYAEPGPKVRALFNSSGQLEISSSMGSAKQAKHIKVGDKVKVSR